MNFDFLSSFTPILAENGFWFAIKESSWPGVVVCAVLALLSCFSWAVMVSKFRLVARASRRDRRFLQAYREERDPLNLYEKGELVQGSPISGVYQAGARELTFHLTGSSETDDNFRDRVEAAEQLRPSQLDAVSNAMDRAVSGATGRLEAQMTVLATAVSGAPFLGLLGTVWGVMDTFSAVASSAGVASLKTMAPGVSAALVTTVVALLVAIPAMFGYNFLVNRIRTMVMGMDNYAAELRLDFERWYVDHAVEMRAVAAAAAAAPVPLPEMIVPSPPMAAPVKKKRLNVKELAPVGAVEPEGDESLAPPEPEPALREEPVPSHRIVKRGEPALIDGEFDLDSVTESN
ncbi:MAG: biopolymer transport protein TolQ [Pseudoalteromonas tetraodonis]|jgi:biopolymer transport protein TolQ